MECFVISNKKWRNSALSNAQDPAGRQWPAGSCACAARMQREDVRKDDRRLGRTRSAGVRTCRCPFQQVHHTIIRGRMQADISTLMNLYTTITKECAKSTESLRRPGLYRLRRLCGSACRRTAAERAAAPAAWAAPRRARRAEDRSGCRRRPDGRFAPPAPFRRGGCAPDFFERIFSPLSCPCAFWSRAGSRRRQPADSLSPFAVTVHVHLSSAASAVMTSLMGSFSRL